MIMCRLHYAAKYGGMEIIRTIMTYVKNIESQKIDLSRDKNRSSLDI